MLSEVGFDYVCKSIQIIICTYVLLFNKGQTADGWGFDLLPFLIIILYSKGQTATECLLPKPHPKLKGNKCEIEIEEREEEKREKSVKVFAPSTKPSPVVRPTHHPIVAAFPRLPLPTRYQLQWAS